MSADDRLTELLLRWEDLREQGQTPSPEEMCRDFPELLGPFREAIGGLISLDDLLGTRVVKGELPPAIDGLPLGTSRFRVLKHHDGGGLGDVFVAVDAELSREVALKQMKPHLADQPDLRRRFLLEAEVTGRLEHPGIVPVYGLGLDAAGRPYYAMRFIRGESLLGAIGKYHQAPAAEQPLQLRQLLSRFVAVCNAVAYAHSRGILHRDLKPANVMMGPYGETLVVDWGLARSVERSEADRVGGEETLAPTPEIRPDATRGTVGTPAYMAPEQAAGLNTLVGPASDVYSLGATLYHLLAGRPAFEKGIIAEVLIKVQRGIFPPPRNLRSDVPRALEAICLKAMALERKDRYSSPTALAADIETFLADEPVAAWREPWSERARRWLKRRRTAVLATAAAAAVALVALGVSNVLLGAARERERVARGEAEDSAARERAERERAEGMFNLAELSGGTLLNLTEDFRPAAETQARTIERALQEVSRRYDELRREGGDRPEVLLGKARVLTSLGEVHLTLGDTAAARLAADDAVALYGRLRAGGDEARYQLGEAAAREQLAQALLFQGKLDQGAAEHRAALALRETLVKADPKQALYPALQARSCNFLGNTLRVRGLDRAAEEQYRQALALCRRAVALDGKLAFARARLAISLEKVGDSVYSREDLIGAVGLYEESLREVTGVIAAGGGGTDRLQHQAQVRLSLGWTRQFLGQPRQARSPVEMALADSERFFEVNPGNREWERLRMQARAYAANFRPGGDPVVDGRTMTDFFRAALASSRERAGRDPLNVEWAAQVASMSRLLAMGLIGLANLGQDERENLKEADALVSAAVTRLEKLHRDLPDHFFIAESLGETYHTVKLIAQSRGDREPARQAAQKWQAHFEAVYGRGLRGRQDGPLWRGRLAGVKRRMTDELGVLGQDYAAAMASAKEAVRLYAKLHEDEPDHVPWLRDLAMAHDAARRSLIVLAGQRVREHHPTDRNAEYEAWRRSPLRADAARHLYYAREARGELVRRQPGVVRWHTELAASYRELADGRRLASDAAGETRYYQKYLDTVEGLARQFPEEAARDPFDDPGPATAGERLGGRAVKVDPKLRLSGLSLAEQSYWLTARPRQGVEMAEGYMDLVRQANLKVPAEAKEARWAVRRALGLLREIKAAGALHPVHARLIPFCEAKVRRLESEPAALPAGWRDAWEGLDFAELARRAKEGGRLADLVGVLDRMVQDSADVPWLMRPVRHRMLEALLLPAGLGEEVLAEARKQAAQLSKPGREQFAWLARLLRDRAAVNELAPAVATAPMPSMLGDRISVRLTAAGRLLAGASVYDEAVRGRRGEAWEYVGVAQAWLGAGRPAEAALALDEAEKKAPGDPLAAQLRVEVLLAGRRFTEARAAIAALLGDKGLKEAMARYLRSRRALALVEEGEDEQAEKELRGLLKQSPEDANAAVALALLLARQGKGADEAAKLVGGARRRHPDWAGAKVAEALVQIAAKKAKEALPGLQKLATVEPTCFDPVVFEALGDAYHHSGQEKEAMAAWKKALALWPKTAKAGDIRRKAIEAKVAGKK